MYLFAVRKWIKQHGLARRRLYCYTNIIIYEHNVYSLYSLDLESMEELNILLNDMERFMILAPRPLPPLLPPSLGGAKQSAASDLDLCTGCARLRLARAGTRGPGCSSFFSRTHITQSSSSSCSREGERDTAAAGSADCLLAAGRGGAAPLGTFLV